MDISKLRLVNQQIVAPQKKSVVELLSQLGAIQAQDFAMAKWAIGLRTVDAREKTIEDAFNRGELLRTHVLRPTWHFVTAQDIDWMLRLTAPRLLGGSHARRTELGIDTAIVHRCLRLLEKTLVGGNALTKEELLTVFSRNALSTDSSVFYHLMMCAELERIVCSGPLKKGKQSYALLAERAPNPVQKTKEEALAELAFRYISTRGPVTLADFVWWSGLTTTEARQAFECNKSRFITEKFKDEVYWMSSSIQEASSSTFLLPAFDEFLICYRNREASISKSLNAKAISSNGIFRPVVVQDGQVVGIWKRSTKPKRMEIEMTPFKPFRQNEVEKELERLSAFWDKEVVYKQK